MLLSPSNETDIADISVAALCNGALGDSGAIVKGTTLPRGGERMTVPLHYTDLFLLGKAEQETLEQEDRLKADLPAPSDEIQLTFFHPGQWSYCGAKGTTRLLCQGGESSRAA